MRFSRMINVVGVHAAGELNEVITGGVLDVQGASMFEKMQYLERKGDDLRNFLLNEPRGRVTQCVNLVLPATRPEADAGFVIMESDFYVPMSGTNTICTTTALLETGMIPMQEPETKLVLEAPAGLVPVTACQCRLNFPQKCRSKIPQLCRCGRQGDLGIFRRPTAWFLRGRKRRGCDQGFGPDMLWHQLGMLPQPVAGSFDLHDDGMVKQSVEQRCCDDGVSEHIAPFCEAAV